MKLNYKLKVLEVQRVLDRVFNAVVWKSALFHQHDTRVSQKTFHHVYVCTGGGLCPRSVNWSRALPWYSFAESGRFRSVGQQVTLDIYRRSWISEIRNKDKKWLIQPQHKQGTEVEKCTDVQREFFTLHHVSHCSTNVNRERCCAAVCSNYDLNSF
jgi:hypothetical protein